MAVLNITYNGLSIDYSIGVDQHVSDQDIRRIAIEVIRSGQLPGLQFSDLPDNTFDYYVVDRFTTTENEQRIYLRPKVPFGCCQLNYTVD